MKNSQPKPETQKMNVVNDETETKLEYGNDESVENMEEVNN